MKNSSFLFNLKFIFTGFYAEVQNKIGRLQCNDGHFFFGVFGGGSGRTERSTSHQNLDLFYSKTTKVVISPFILY